MFFNTVFVLLFFPKGQERNDLNREFEEKAEKKRVFEREKGYTYASNTQ